MEPIKVFIGWDRREPLAFAVAAHSILRRASVPVSIIPLAQQGLGRIYTRERGPTESTEFSLTRFLVPYLSGYQGQSVFIDCDVLVQVDLLDLWLHLLADPGRAIWCVQHDYSPAGTAKFLGQAQTVYPRKNWSSVLVFDNAQCRALTPEYVNQASGLELHRFAWLAQHLREANHFGATRSDDAKIGALPLTWNWLVGEYPANPDANILHFTNGTPCFDGYGSGPEAERWWAEYADMRQPMTAGVEVA